MLLNCATFLALNALLSAPTDSNNYSQSTDLESWKKKTLFKSLKRGELFSAEQWTDEKR